MMSGRTKIKWRARRRAMATARRDKQVVQDWWPEGPSAEVDEADGPGSSQVEEEEEEEMQKEAEARRGRAAISITTLGASRGA